MERESFEDEEVAAALNRTFVCIKVDREERPDLDSFYMAVCQALTGSGGWPLTILMTADRQPFYAGTYFPKTGRYGRPGLLELTIKVSDVWQHQRSGLLETATEILEHLRQPEQADGNLAAISLELLDKAYRQLTKRYDRENGGFGEAPKFPTAHALTWLLRYWRRTGQAEALQMVLQTLRQMGNGGIYDQVGFGFHRYSTDRHWLLPHFEKMLYDQALLAIALLEAYQATEQPDLAERAREVFTYVLRDMTAPEGAFYSAEDADSEGEEGKFYVWSEAELRQVLSVEELCWLRPLFDISEQGNFREEASRQRLPVNILHLTRPWDDWAKELGDNPEELRGRWQVVRRKLLAAREQRPRPHLDDKILTDWNGLMIAALALGGRVLQEDTWTQAAARAARFLLQRLRQPDGRLLKRYRAGTAGLPAHLDDYAFFGWGLLELYQSSFASEWLEAAVELNRLMVQLFQDQAHGGFWLTAADQTEVPVRIKDSFDGALPAGNSVAALNCLRLGRLLGDESLVAVAERALFALGGQLAARPSAYTQLLQAADFYLGPSFEVVIAGEPGQPDTDGLLRAVSEWYQPRQVVALRPAQAEAILQLAPYLADYCPLGGQATAYVCSSFVCQQPTTERQELLRQLGKESD